MALLVAAAPNCLALDIDQPITDALLDRLDGVRVTVPGQPESMPVRGLARYVSLRAPELPGDISAAEVKRVTGRGYGLWLVQHVLNPGWQASGPLGRLLGDAARENAKAAGYLEGAHLALDVEGTASSGQDVLDFINEWAGRVMGDFPPCEYKGYESGLTPDQHYYGTPNVHLFWCAHGQTVGVCGPAIQQGLPIQVAGAEWDPDIIGTDLRGRRLQWMVDPEAVSARFPGS